MAIIPVSLEFFPTQGQAQPPNSQYGGAVTNQADPQTTNIVFDLPWCIDPESSWLDYQCGIAIMLDPGSVLHKPLPQSDPAWDTLGTLNITDPNFGGSTLGINLNSNSHAVDIIQRMASSTYRFVLHGWGIRVGYRIPIPNLVKIGNVAAVPTDPHFGDNIETGSVLGGIPVWHAQWELHYIVAESPTITQASEIPTVPNPAAHVGPNRQLPNKIQAPQGVPDYHTVIAAQAPLQFGQFVQANPQRTGRLGVFM